MKNCSQPGDMSIKVEVTSNDSHEFEETDNVEVISHTTSTRSSSSAEMPYVPATSHKPIKTATTNAFDKIFHAYDDHFLPSRVYSKIIPEKHRRKSSVKIDDIKWMIHPHSQFKYVIFTHAMVAHNGILLLSLDSFGILLW